jgi:hypothetical protein
VFIASQFTYLISGRTIIAQSAGCDVTLALCSFFNRKQFMCVRHIKVLISLMILNLICIFVNVPKSVIKNYACIVDTNLTVYKN